MKNDAALKRKIKDLEEENNFLKQIISHIPGNVYWKNKQGFYLGCNKNAAKFVRTLESEIKGKTIYDLLDKEMAKEIDKTDKKIMRGKKRSYLGRNRF